MYNLHSKSIDCDETYYNSAFFRYTDYAKAYIEYHDDEDYDRVVNIDPTIPEVQYTICNGFEKESYDCSLKDISLPERNFIRASHYPKFTLYSASKKPYTLIRMSTR